MSDRRLRACVEAWPDAEDGMYDPRCCRFPKSCSPYPYQEAIDAGNVTDADLEPLRVHPGDPRPTTGGPVVWDSAAPRVRVRIRAYHGDSGSVLVGDATAITRDGVQGYRVICDGLLEEVVIWCGPWHVVQLP